MKRRRVHANRLAPVKPGAFYRQVWRLVDGAVANAFRDHPEYLRAGTDLRTARTSIVKRVTGAIIGYAEQSAQGRSGEARPAADTPGLECKGRAGGAG